MNYIFYDFETTGRDSNWDQIIQVGAILTNSNFQEIDRFDARCVYSRYYTLSKSNISKS